MYNIKLGFIIMNLIILIYLYSFYCVIINLSVHEHYLTREERNIFLHNRIV